MNMLLAIFRAAPVTIILIAVSVIVTLSLSLSSYRIALPFFISSTETGDLSQIASGEIWRLITPIFIHAPIFLGLGVLHILFNMLWLYDLGLTVESRKGSPHFGLLVGVSGITGNLAEYFWSGPAFGGMSGVVYALLAYVWVQGKLNPRSGLELHPNIALMMLVWFVVCWLGLVGNVANMAHTAGVVSGLLLGWLFSPNKRVFR